MTQPCSLAAPLLVYKPQLRELWVAGRPVLALTSRAVRLCAILEAFQECGWRSWTLVPLKNEGPPGLERPLHDAVYGLNHRQTVRLLDFSCEDERRIVRWRWHCGRKEEVANLGKTVLPLLRKLRKTRLLKGLRAVAQLRVKFV